MGPVGLLLGVRMKKIIFLASGILLASCTTNPGYNMGAGAATGAAVGCLLTIPAGCAPGAALGAAAGAGAGLMTTQPYYYPPY